MSKKALILWSEFQVIHADKQHSSSLNLILIQWKSWNLNGGDETQLHKLPTMKNCSKLHQMKSERAEILIKRSSMMGDQTEEVLWKSECRVAPTQLSAISGSNLFDPAESILNIFTQWVILKRWEGSRRIRPDLLQRFVGPTVDGIRSVGPMTENNSPLFQRESKITWIRQN